MHLSCLQLFSPMNCDRFVLDVRVIDTIVLLTATNTIATFNVRPICNTKRPSFTYFTHSPTRLACLAYFCQGKKLNTNHTPRCRYHSADLWCSSSRLHSQPTRAHRQENNRKIRPSRTCVQQGITNLLRLQALHSLWIANRALHKHRCGIDLVAARWVKVDLTYVCQ